jgi:hypothetical protein
MLTERMNNLSIILGQKMGLRRALALAIAAIFVLAMTSTGNELGRLSIISDSHFAGPEIPADITEDVIAYDGEPARYIANPNQIGSVFAVRFTPAQACSLTYITVASYSPPPPQPGPAIIHVYSDNNGEPGEDLITPFVVVLSSDGSRQRVNLSEAIDIGENDFHVGVEYTQTPPPYLTIDNDGGTGRSRSKIPEGNWIVIAGNDLNFRSYVIYYASDQVPPAIVSAQRILGFSGEGDHPITATITDASGILSASVHYSIDGIEFSSVPMDSTSDNIWIGDIPAQPIGTTVYYYIQAIDNSPYQNEAMLPESGPSEPFIMEIVEGLELAYDDGSAEIFWIVGDIWNDNQFAVRFTPDDHPVLVTGARSLVDDAAPFEFTINADINERPGEVLAGPFMSYQNMGDWAVTFFPEDQSPEITSGDFWLIFHWLENSPGSPGVGTDLANPDLRSFWYTTQARWNLLETGDFIMRVIVTTPTVAVEPAADDRLPETFELLGNYPNPFNPVTEITFAAPRSGHVRLEIFNIIGQRVRTILDETVAAGRKAVTWDSTDDNGQPVASGIYYCRLSTEDGIDVRKMTFMK